jgi:ferrous iron transport protein B
MKPLRILLIGQPNVGKSSLLNALVGPRVTVSNYPGTTVEITKAKKRFDKTQVEFVDTPGIYSISDRSEEEKVTERALFEEDADGAVVIVDAASLERGLYMALQILEARIPTVLALNFVEDAEKKGITVSNEKLKVLLQVPVVLINPLTKRGIRRLAETVTKIGEISKRFFAVQYDDHIESAIERVSSQLKETAKPSRFIAVRILEGDEDFYRFLKDEGTAANVGKTLAEHPRVAEDIAVTRYGTASFIAAKVTRIAPLEKEEDFQENVDRVLLHRAWGPLATGLFLLATFGMLLYLGNVVQGLLTSLTESLLSSLAPADQSFFTVVLVNGVTGIALGVSIALPYVFLFYLLMGFLEDVGLLSRFTVNAEWFLKRMSLPAKSFIPLALGLGCTAPAARATRVLSSEKEQFHTASLFAFVPCSSRIAIVMGVVGFYGGTNLALSVFATSFVAGLIWAFGVKKLSEVKSEPLLLELPPYRRPLIRNVLAKSWIRMKDFVYIVIPLLALGGIAYGILDMAGLTSIVVNPLSPITGWLGLPAVTIIPIVFGFLQKDLTGAMLLSVLGSEISSSLTSLQIYSFGVATTVGIPCMIAAGMLIKEFGLKRAIALTMTSIAYGVVFAGLAWRILSLI